MEGSESDSESDVSSGSDIDLDNVSGDDGFSSDTDDDNESETQATQSSLSTLGSQLVEVDDNFWSHELHDVEIAQFQEASGPSHNLGPNDHIFRYFTLMLPNDFFRQVATENNRYAAQTTETTGRLDINWTQTDEREMKAYFGLWIMMGIIQLPEVHMYWSDNKFLGNKGFKECMPRNRFSKISQYLHLNDNNTQGDAGSLQYDRLHKVRPVVNMTRQAFKTYYKPGKCQSIDEGMVRYKGQHYARQYAPCKPIKRGLKIWMRCEPTGYTHDYRLYLGQHDEMQGQGLGERVVKHLCKELKWKGHHVFIDRFFTSIPLVQSLESYGIYACGTIKTNRKGFPAELKNPRLERGDAEQLQHDNLVATVWNDNKPVHLLSTTSNPIGDEPACRRVRGGGFVVLQRPQPVQHYQQNYCGVDRSQQYRSKNPIGRPSKKFWKYFLNFILEICMINSFLLWKETPGTVKPQKHYSLIDFTQQIAEFLVGNFTCRKRGARVLPCNPMAQHGCQRQVGAKRRCKWCSSQGVRRETIFGCSSLSESMLPNIPCTPSTASSIKYLSSFNFFFTFVLKIHVINIMCQSYWKDCNTFRLT